MPYGSIHGWMDGWSDSKTVVVKAFARGRGVEPKRARRTQAEKSARAKGKK